MKKHKQAPRIPTTFPTAKSRPNAPISSTFSLDPVPPPGCLGSSCSSSSSSSLRSHFPNNKLKSHPKPSVAARTNLPKTRSKLHSKENDFPNTTSRKLGNRRPVSKPAQRSKLLADLSNSSSGSEQFQLNPENLKHGHDGIGSGTQIRLPQPQNSVFEETYTPFGKGNKDTESDSVSGRAKTPPIEASVSPEIQFGAAAAVSTGSTPVCYGTSHILSGVKDKRKCRSKGILIIGDEIDVSVEDDDHKFTNSRPSFVPCPANAAMIWLSSPKKHENVSDASFGSPILSGFDGLLGGSGSPSSLLSEKYSLSSSSLSCGNVVQTPTSDLSSDHQPVENSCWTDTNSHKREQEEERVSCVSDCTLASMSFTGLRISWREGLLGGQSFDRDENDLDCCRCLSDEEEEYDCQQTTSSSQGVVTENPKPFGSVENEKKAAMFRAEATNVSAESISLDGDRLIASGDSDWTLDYKNHFFPV